MLKKFLLFPIGYGTRYRGVFIPPSSGWCLYAMLMQPVLWLFIGVFYALISYLTCKKLALLDGFVLFYSFIYLFFLEWTTRFQGLHEFSCMAFLLRQHALPSKEQIDLCKYEINDFHGESPCTLMYISGKILLMYIIFMKAVFYTSDLLFFTILATLPSMARTASLYSVSLNPGDSVDSIKVRRSLKILFPVTREIMVFLSALIPSIIIAYHRYFVLGKPLSSRKYFIFHSFVEIFQQFLTNPLIIKTICYSMCFYFLMFYFAIRFSAEYWNQEAKSKFGAISIKFAETIRETAEFIILAVYLFIMELVDFF